MAAFAEVIHSSVISFLCRVMTQRKLKDVRTHWHQYKVSLKKPWN